MNDIPDHIAQLIRRNPTPGNIRALKELTSANNNRVTVPTSNMESNPWHGTKKAHAVEAISTRVSLHLHSKRYGEPDADGVSAKWAIDGIVIAGLLRDDKSKYVSAVTYSNEKISRNEKEVTIITLKG
jgi:hypothetical protein